MFAIVAVTFASAVADEGEEWNGTVDGEAEEARGKGGDAPEKTARSFRQETS
jgi:hypothetical protein